MTLIEKILSLYPELVEFDFASNVITLQNDSDGRGDYIAKWEHPTLAKPTDDVLYENTNLTSLNKELA
jgi:hypothetical protein